MGQPLNQLGGGEGQREAESKAAPGKMEGSGRRKDEGTERENLAKHGLVNEISGRQKLSQHKRPRRGD